MGNAVDEVFETYTQPVQDRLRKMRALILDVGANAGVEVEETLKWGQPSYLAKKGSTLRLGAIDGEPALFAHCQSRIIPEARMAFGDALTFSGNRAVILDDKAGEPELRQIVLHGLTYHRRRS